MDCRDRTSSEQQLQRELNLSRCVRGRGNRAGRRVVVVAREHQWIRCSEVRMIENVERLRPKLHVHLLRDVEFLGQRRIQIPEAGANKTSSRDVTEGSCKRQQESIGIVPPAGLTQNDSSRKVGIQVGYIGTQSVPAARDVGADLRSEWESALNVQRSTPLPAADQFVR